MLTTNDLISTSCPVCGSNHVSKVCEVYDHEFQTTDLKFRVVSCDSCATVYLSPRPSTAAFSIIYPANYGNYNTNRDKSSYVQQISSYLQKSRLRNTIINLLNKEKFTVLDVGCGDGYMLDRIKEAFPLSQRYGVEPNKEAANIAQKNHNVYNGFLEDYSFVQKFDLIISSHVIEHVENPINFLMSLSKFLAEDGFILVDTPNYNSLQRIIFGKHWGGYHAPRHWTFFTDKSIIKCGLAAGLETINVTHMPLNIFWIWSIHSLLYSNKNLIIFANKYFGTRDVLSKRSIYYLLLAIIAESLERFSIFAKLGSGQVRATFRKNQSSLGRLS
jgi:SAM-dependent methyltransferase